MAPVSWWTSLLTWSSIIVVLLVSWWTSLLTWSSVIVVLLVSYKLLIVSLRRKRLQLLLSLNPVRDAHTVNWIMSYVEFPHLSNVGGEMAFFRTYGIPSISKILWSTAEFRDRQAKRVEDSQLIGREMSMHHPDGPRGSYTIRRLNLIHSGYKIQNLDYVYTLAVVIVHVVRWIERHGFRKLTEVEKTAQFVVWYDIGVRMGIQDIPKSFEEMAKFCDEYEEKHMVYRKGNHIMAEQTLSILLSRVPSFIRPLVRRVLYANLDDRLREAMGFPEQPKWLQTLCFVLYGLLPGVCISWALPPRPMSWATDPIVVDVLEEEASLDPQQTRPVKHQFQNPPFYPNGYRLGELGPPKFEFGKLGKHFEGDLICPLALHKERLTQLDLQK